MSLEEALQKRKRLLKARPTKVTTLDGRSYVEYNGVISEKKSCPGYIVDMKPDLRYTHVLSTLILGSQDVAHNAEIISTNKITHILNVATGVDNIFDHIVYKNIESFDTPEFKLDFDECGLFIHEALKSGGIVLVHCNAGVSRAASVVIGYLIKYHKMSMNEAYNLVKEKRPFIRPNDGFMEQLREYGGQ